MEELDVDEIDIFGAARTTGRNLVGLRGRFGSCVELMLRRNGPIAHPVHLARRLKAFGLGLSEAHKALNRIVADEPVVVCLGGADRATMIAELAELGVTAE